MKNSRIISMIRVIVLIFMSVFLFQACEEIINVPSQGALAEDVVNDRRGVQGLLIGVYGALDGAGWQWQAPPNNWIYGSIAGGEAHKGSTATDQPAILRISNHESEPSIAFLNGKWEAQFEGIVRANTVIRVLETVDDMTDAEKEQVIAQARFLRGHFYFELKRMFNMVPWIDENTTDPNQPNDVDIWPNIEADFKFAMDTLPEIQQERARVNKWAAASYLAKTYVYQQKWQDAKSLYDNIIVNGVTSQGVKYGLLDNYRDTREPDAEDGSPESVFYVQQVADDGTGSINNSNRANELIGTQGTGNAVFFQPTQDLVNSYRTNSDGLPYIYDYNQHPVKHDMQVAVDENFELDSGELDPRLDWTAGRRGLPYLDWGPHGGSAPRKWVRDRATAGPYNHQKNIYYKQKRETDANLNNWAPGNAINIDIIRFADVLLMAAEAEVEVGSLERAREYVNRVRQRVADGSYGDGWVTYTDNQFSALSTVDSEEQMIALNNVRPFDFVIRTDRKSTFVLLKSPSTDPANWQEYVDANYKIDIYPTGHPAFSSRESARDAVHFERKLELSMEGHRFFDLVRWGKAAQELNAFFAFEGPAIGISTRNGRFISNKNEYYPIPQRQIDLSEVNGVPVLKQNPGYN